MKKITGLLSVALLGIFLAGCGPTKIGKLLADPTRYNNRNVSVEGTVTNSVGALGVGGYQIEDDTGKVFVVSTGSGVPTKGARVKVSGRVQTGVTVLGRSYGTTIRESSHKVRY